MDWLIRQAVRYRVAVLLLAAGLCVAGVWTTLETPVDVFPDLTAPTVAIITEAGGAAATDVEWQVTFPIESVMSGARGVRRVRSLTGIGVSVVWVEFEWDVSMRDARQTVAERLSLVRAQIPEDVGVPFMAPESSIMGDILFVGILAKDGADVGEEELRSLAEIEIRRRLLSVPGVAQVAVLGGLRKEYQVHLFPNRLLVHGIGLADVARALRASNENRTAGFAEAAGTQYVVRGEGLLRTLDDIRDTVVEAHETAPVTVRDLADVRTGGAPRIGVGAINGRPGVVVSVQKQPGVNTLQLSESLDEALDDIESRLPPDVRLARDLFEQRSFIDVAVRNVFHALRDGSILVVVIMIIFLANVRATLITLLAIPLSLFAAVIVLEAWGESLNTMTLGGF
ncbi:MAG TPA: efflux RND transporter permease subunit, partial [Planctomycetota bacterium]|nr:efflux RND transporter permease subunit [Planctomycetota bacterium]